MINVFVRLRVSICFLEHNGNSVRKVSTFSLEEIVQLQKLMMGAKDLFWDHFSGDASMG